MSINNKHAAGGYLSIQFHIVIILFVYDKQNEVAVLVQIGMDLAFIQVGNY